MKNAQAQKVVIGLLCVVVFAVVFYQFSWKARAATLAKASEVQAATELKQADLVAAQKAQAKQDENRAALAQMQVALPGAPDAQGVIRQLTQLAVASNVTWDSVTIGATAAPASESGLQQLPITVTISGQMADVEAYLANIRSPDVARLITVDGLSTAFNTDEKDPAVVSETVTLRAFMYGTAAVADTTPTTAVASATGGVTQTPAGSVPQAMPDHTNVEAASTTVAAQG